MNINGIRTHLNFRLFNKNIFNYKFILKKSNYLYLIIFLILFLISLLIFNFKHFYNNNFDSSFIKDDNRNLNLDYDNYTFLIIKRENCSLCGLFSDYIIFLGCINEYISRGLIPIIDLQSYNNVFNGFNVNLSNENPWEIFFNQPFGYSLNDVLRKGKNLKYVECFSSNYPSLSIFSNEVLMGFWHNLAKQYIPVKTKMLLKSKLIIKNLFKKSKNVLGILMRGTDYISKKPKNHPIPPTPEIVLNDIKEMNNKNNYDWYFISTEDDIIRQKFREQLGNKLKYYSYNKAINYNYKQKQFLSDNEIVKGNINYMETYLLNIIILSQCIDIICARTSGAIGVFILKNGFRNSKYYNMGCY